MPAKKDAATELAAKMLQVLETQRRLGPDAYPLLLRRLAELTDPAAPPERVLKASAQRKPFGERTVIARARDLDAPIALAEDAEQLAASRLLLEFLLNSVCTADSPTCEPSKLKKKAPAKLKQAFGAALNRRLAEGNLAPGVALVFVKKKKHLHLERYPRRPEPEEVLAADLVRVLQEQRRLGGDAYPLTLSRLVELARPGADAELVKKAVAEPVFQEAVVLAMKDRPESPVALARDAELLLGSRLLLETALRLTRKNSNQVCTPTELSKQVVPALRQPLEQAVRRQIEGRSLPAAVGCLLQKNKPLLFLMTDVLQAAGAPSGPAAIERPVPAREAEPEPAALFARAFDEAFERLDRQRGSHNAVSLVDLRRALAVDRQTFDTELGNLRRARRYTLSGAEGRHGISAEERQAGIYEDGSLLLYVSRKLA